MHRATGEVCGCLFIVVVHIVREARRVVNPIGIVVVHIIREARRVVNPIGIDVMHIIRDFTLLQAGPRRRR